ncbi:MAG: helix-turn-helix domain-containing protein [Pseudomonadota bacterium]
MSEPTYSLDDLAERSETPARTIRYYIQRGLVSRPHGEKRGAHYSAAHLRQLLQIRKWVGAGMSLQRIAALLQDEAPDAVDTASAAPLADAPGVEAGRYDIRSAHAPAPFRYPEPPEEVVSVRDAGPTRAYRAAREPASGAGTPTLKQHYPVAPGIELVLDPARSALTPEQADTLLDVIRDHLARLASQD